MNLPMQQQMPNQMPQQKPNQMQQESSSNKADALSLVTTSIQNIQRFAQGLRNKKDQRGEQVLELLKQILVILSNKAKKDDLRPSPRPLI